MSDDEKAIRDLVSSWLAATRSGDVETVLALMSEDVIFMVPGNEPFGREQFAAASRRMKDVQLDPTSEIIELKILGDWAWMRSRLRIVVTPPMAEPMVRSGLTLTILRKNAQGRWLIERDANLLTSEAKAT